MMHQFRPEHARTVSAASDSDIIGVRASGYISGVGAVNQSAFFSSAAQIGAIDGSVPRAKESCVVSTGI